MADDKTKTVEGEDRRGFLRSFGVGAVVGTAAIATGAVPAAAEEKPAKEGTGYRETEHVRTYYDLAKF